MKYKTLVKIYEETFMVSFLIRHFSDKILLFFLFCFLPWEYENIAYNKKIPYAYQKNTLRLLWTKIFIIINVSMWPWSDFLNLHNVFHLLPLELK